MKGSTFMTMRYSAAIFPDINESVTMLKFLGGTVGIIFLIGLIVVIALFKFIF